MASDFRELGNCILDQALCAFGESIKYFPKSGGRYSLNGIFDNQFEQVDPETDQVVASNQLTVGIKLKDLPVKPAKGDKVEVREKLHYVIDSQEDGVSGAVLFLHEVD